MKIHDWGLFLLLSVSSQNALAQAPILSENLSNLSYGYHPDSNLWLGGGFHVAFPERATMPCLDFNKSMTVSRDTDTNDGTTTANGSVRTDIKAYVIKSRQELHEKLSISTSIGAHLAFFKAGPSADILSELENSYLNKLNSIYYVFIANSDYGRFSALDYRLKPMYQKLIDDGKNEQFVKFCGTHFVMMEQRRAAVVILLKIDQLENTEKNEISGSVAAKAGNGAISGNVSAAIKTLMEKGNALGTVSLEIFAIGGDGISNVGNLTSIDTNQPESVIVGIRKFVEGMGNKSAPYRYYLAPMSLLGLQSTAQMEVIDDELINLYYEYIEARQQIAAISQYLENSPWLLVPAAESHRSTVKQLQIRLREIESAAHYLRENRQMNQSFQLQPLPPLNFEAEQVTVKVTRAEFVCNVNNSTFCGQDPWIMDFVKPYNWSAQVSVEGKINIPQYIESIQLVAKIGPDEVEIASAKGSEFVQTNGKFTLNSAAMSLTSNLALFNRLTISPKIEYALKVQTNSGDQLTIPVATKKMF